MTGKNTDDFTVQGLPSPSQVKANLA